MPGMSSTRRSQSASNASCSAKGRSAKCAPVPKRVASSSSTAPTAAPTARR